MSNEDLAYIAGIIDGEGCIFCSPNGHSYQLGFKLSMCNKEAVEFVAGYFGYDIQDYTYTTKGGKEMHTFFTSGARAKRILEELSPYLIVKKKHAEVALEFPVMSPNQRLSKMDKEDREMIFGCLRELNA